MIFMFLFIFSCEVIMNLHVSGVKFTAGIIFLHKCQIFILKNIGV